MTKENQTNTFGNKAKKYLKELPKRYFITAFSGMAQGLFVTLIAGTILATIATELIETSNYIGQTLLYIANIAKILMGVGIGVGIANALGKSKLIIFSAAVAGFIGAWADQLVLGGGGFDKIMFLISSKQLPGNPISSYVVTMFVIEIVDLYDSKTKLDIILIPIGVLIFAFMGIFIAFPFAWLVNKLGDLIAIATNFAPVPMGMFIAVVMGILLTMPTSSAAIWVAVSSSVSAGNEQAMLIAGGAATVGCACHMVGFAVASFRENGFGGLIAQGLGTSMLQIPNIMVKPIIMLPMIISSAILGAFAPIFGLMCSSSGGGMGTSGLVGVIDLFTNTTGALGITGIILLMFVLPAILNIVISEFMRKKGLIKFGDMKLPD